MSLFRTLHVGLDERVLEYVDGAFRRELGPGRHRRGSRRRAQYRTVPVTEQLQAVAPQEVPTSDGVPVRVSAAVRWRVTDRRRFVEVAREPVDVLYLSVQVALREHLAGLQVDAVVREARAVAGSAMHAAVTNAAEELGIEVRALVVKDVVVPAEVRLALADLATARTRGQARLESARAETAALRSLANAARMLEEHPALARQRLVESLPPGSVVKIG